MVYVDNFCHGPQRWCHLAADTERELDEFASGIGLKREWKQTGTRFTHYDVTWGMRGRCLRAGARSVTSRELVAILGHREQENQGGEAVAQRGPVAV